LSYSAYESSKGNGKIVSKGADLAALVCEVIYELAVLAIFARKRFSELEDRAIEYQMSPGALRLNVHTYLL
jgi:hypothetical protein